MPNSEQSLSIQYRVSERDFISASELAFLQRSQTSRTLLLILPTLGGVLLAVALILASHGSQTLVGPVFTLGSVPLLLPLISRSRTRRSYRSSVEQKDPRGLVADAYGLRIWSFVSKAAPRWTEFASFAENDHTFVLLERRGPFLPIPKRDLSATQIGNLRTLLEFHLPRT